MGTKNNAASHSAIQYTMCNTIHNAQYNTQCSMYNYVKSTAWILWHCHCWVTQHSGTWNWYYENIEPQYIAFTKCFAFEFINLSLSRPSQNTSIYNF